MVGRSTGKAIGTLAMTVLHLVCKLDRGYPIEIVAAHERDESVRVRVVYLQDGVYLPRRGGSSGRVEEFVLSEDLEARGLPPEPGAISYGELVNLIFESDRVVSW